MADRMNPYGSIIRNERMRRKMGLDGMAVRLMMSPSALKAVESGNRWFSEAELRLASSALSLNREGLLRGERAERTKTEVIRDLLSEFYKDLRELTRIQESILRKITEISPWQRFSVDQIRKGKGEPETYEPVQYAIFDNERGDYVRDKNGDIVFFQTAAEAFERADEMEHAVKFEKDARIEKVMSGESKERDRGTRPDGDMPRDREELTEERLMKKDPTKDLMDETLSDVKDYADQKGEDEPDDLEDLIRQEWSMSVPKL